ncbi:MAG: tetratricopeptide repeat protein [Leptolyngbya sp. RL_3_1]|nr:tetratricopeptide repeat protein [Leptolyngbya sp. RL_3_1]
MARPARLLSLAVFSVLLVPATQFAGSWQLLRAAEAGNRSLSGVEGEGLRGLGDRFLSGSGAGHPATHQEPVPLSAPQIPGFFGAGDPLRLGTTQEPWDLDPLNGAEPQIEALTVLVVPPKILAQVDSELAEASHLFTQGNEQFRRSQFQNAITAWEQALEILRVAGNLWGESIVLNALGSAYRNLSQYEQAIAFYEESISIARRIDDRAVKGMVLSNLGNVYSALAQYNRSIDFHEQSLEIARALGDSFEEGRILGNLGNVYNSLAEYETAIELHQQSSPIQE